MSDAILADITSRDPARIHGAMWEIAKTRNAAVLDALAAALPEIERATADLDLGGIVYSNNRSLAFALRRLAYHRDREGCLCRLYPEILLIDPEREAEAGHVRITGEEYVDGRGPYSWECECTDCGTAYHVVYGEAHASWWEWRPVSASS